jgi:hypothetical protein
LIYFIQASDGGPIKIGQTVRLSTRIKQHAVDRGATMRLLGVMDGGRAVEQSIHLMFSHLRVNQRSAVSEWFEPAPELIAFIESNSRPWDGTDDAPPIRSKVIVTLKADERTADAYRDWIEGLAEHCHTTVPVLFDMALQAMAHEFGYKRQAKRLVR